ncbi:MAG: ATP-binding protein [Clostridia bacterium]|nr:ATP-binding protein [Clostridia bacterium]
MKKEKIIFFSPRIENLFTYKTLLLVLFGIVINVLFPRLVIMLHLPLYLDNIGSIFVAVLSGAIPGMITAFTSNYLGYFGEPSAIMFGVLTVVIAFLSAKISETGLLRKVRGYVLLFVMAVIVGGVVGSVFGWYLYGKTVGGTVAAPYVFWLCDCGLQGFLAQFLGDMIVDISDKLITVLAVASLLCIFPRKLRNAFPLSYIYKCSDDELVMEYKKNKHPYSGVSVYKKILNIIVAALAIMSIVVTFYSVVEYCIKVYSNDYDVNALLTYIIQLVGVEFVVIIFMTSFAGWTVYNTLKKPIDEIVKQSIDFSESDPEEWLESDKWKNHYVVDTNDEVQVLYETICQSEERIARTFDTIKKNALIEKQNIELQHKIEVARVESEIRSEIEDVLLSAGIGIWRIELFEGEKPRMHADAQMKRLLAIEGKDLSPEETYDAWYSGIKESYLPSVNANVNEMIEKGTSENTYVWIDPKLGEQFVRCGGTAYYVEGKGYILRGYHSNVTVQVEKEQMQNQKLKDALEDARKANAAKSVFLSQMSHDIRTPLNGIIGLLNLDSNHPDDLKLLNENREKAKVAANHLLSLVNDVLELSKLDDQNIEFVNEVFNVAELTSDVMTISQMRAIEYGITLNCDTEKAGDSALCVYGSPLHVRQILLNIFSNAIKYNKSGGSVNAKIEMTEKDDCTVTYRYTISDTGIGMSEEFIKHIFEPFTQEHTDARSTFKGTGLGMAIVKRLVDKMNGTIEISSQKGVGSTFIVTLPFEISKEKAESKPDEKLTHINISGIKVLLVDDVELNLEIAQMLLEDEGVVITTASDGQQALNVFANSPEGTYNAILMDVMMPVMNGLEATRAIRALNRPDAKTIPIIAMTANAFAEDARSCIEAGMNEHLSKPLNMQILISTLAKYLK